LKANAELLVKSMCYPGSGNREPAREGAGV
jgi:hypothetical protein